MASQAVQELPNNLAPAQQWVQPTLRDKFRASLTSVRSEVSFRLLMVAMAVSLTNVMNGYDNTFWAGYIANTKFCEVFCQGTLEPVPGLIIPFPSAQQQTTVMVTTSGSSFTGALIGAQLVKKYGYKRTFLIYGALLTIGTVLELTSYVNGARWAQVIMGKVVVGISSGIGALEAVGYLSEISPTAVRGATVALSTLSYTIGGMIGSIMLLALEKNMTNLTLYLPFGFQLLLPLIILVIYTYVPESPRWLLAQGNRVQASRNLRWLRKLSDSDPAADEELSSIESAIKAQEQSRDNAASWSQLFKGSDRRRSIVVVITTILWSMSGIAFMSGYSIILFRQVGLAQPFLVSTISSIFTIVAIMTSMAIIDAVGRRFILIAGGIASCSSLFAFAIAGTVTSDYSGAVGNLMIFFIVFYLFCFGISWAITPTIISSELPSERMRSKTIALGQTGQQGAIMLVVAVNPYLQDPSYANLGVKVAYIYAAFGLISIIWVYFMIPETRGRPLEELDRLFELNLPARKFKNYQLDDLATQHDDSLDDVDRKEDTTHLERQQV